MNEFVNLFRQPDAAYGATEASPYRFEERVSNSDNCRVKFDYQVGKNSAKVIVYPSGDPVTYLKLRFNGDLSFVDKVFGDQWERAGSNTAPLAWSCVMNYRVLPWYCYAIGHNCMACYGVKTGPDCFAYWQIDTQGVTLFMNLKSGNRGTDLKQPLTACEIVQLFGDEGEDAYKVACRFATMMCENPVVPKSPVFGVNNWYWAYGNISKKIVLEETDYLLKMTEGVTHKPYMIIDDGWQFNRTYGQNAYIGGPWDFPNALFGDMKDTTDQIHYKGCKAGLWFRPMLTLGRIPDEAHLANADGGQILDPSHPYTLERVYRDAQRIHEWGFDLIKHDFSTCDITGFAPLSAKYHHADMTKGDRRFFDNTKTTATIIKNLYKAIQNGAGKSDIIGCNVIGHLSAGIHSLQRVGDDTSGRSFEWTVRNGVSSAMRLPQNDRFFRIDPDCAAFTGKVDANFNLDFLELCAITGMTTLASVTPGSLTDTQLKRIQEIYRTADQNTHRYGIVNYDKVGIPDQFVSQDRTSTRRFNWASAYDGSRSVLNWFE